MAENTKANARNTAINNVKTTDVSTSNASPRLERTRET